MLNLVYGAAGSGKTEYMYEKIRANTEENIKSFILVPEQASMDTEREMIKRLGLSSQLSVEVLTFSRLSNRVFSRCGPLRMKYIDRAGRIFVVQKTMQNLEKKLKYYQRNVHQNGFAQMVSNLISELKRYGVTAEMLSLAAEKTEIEELKLKISDISMIYEEYDRLISGKYSDAEENLIKAIPGISKSGLFGGEVFVFGFKSFTPVEHRALAEFMRSAEVTVFLCTDTLSNSGSIFASAANTWNILKEDAQSVNTSVGEIKFLEGEVKFKDNAELAFLKNNYFSYSDNIYKEETHNIFVISAKDGYDEVRRCAEIISGLCRKSGYSQGDFLILARNGESYRAAMKAVFEEYKINCFLNEKKSLGRHPFVRKVLSAAEILAYGFSCERIMPIVRFDNKNYTRAEADVFENYILASNISHKYWNSGEDWQYNPDKRRISLETVNKVKRYTVNSVQKLGQSLKGRKTVRDICGALLEWMRSEELDKIMSEKVEGFNREGKASVAMEYSRAWNAFSSVISQMEQCMGGDCITYEKFLEMIRAACDEVPVSITPPSANQVTFAEIDTFRKSDAKVVIVLGMTDGVFPKGYIEDGMLSDNERSELCAAGVELAPTAEVKRREEQVLIYNVLTAAREKIYLSVPMGDKEGKAVQKSEIIDRLCTIFPNITAVAELGEAAADSRDVIFKSLLGALAAAKGDIRRLSRQDKIIYDYFAEDEERKEELEQFANSVRTYSPDASLSPRQARELYGKKLMLSVSKLEKYNACAFSYFLNYGLLIKERTEAGFEANNLGTILHETMCRYLKELKQSDADYSKISQAECKSRISKIADKYARESDELLYETSPYYRYVVLRLQSVAAATAWEIVNFYANSAYRPYGFEVKIGGDGIFSGMKIDLGDGACAELEGSIDRVDMAEIKGEKYVNIVDYKSSAKTTHQELEEAGVQIQPLVYAGAACKNLNANPSGIMYVHMTDPILTVKSDDDEEIKRERRKKIEVSGIVADDAEIIGEMDRRTLQKGEISYIPKEKTDSAEMKRRIESAEAKVEETAFKIVSGDISIKPYLKNGYNACQYCKFYSICGKVKKA